MKKGCAFLILLPLLLLVAMFITCPKENDHRLAIMNLCNEVIEAKVEQSGVNKWLQSAGIDLGDAQQVILGATGNVSANLLMNNMIRIDDYYVVSVGRLRVGQRDYVVSVGVLNHVFTPDKETVIEVMDSYLR